MSYCAGALSIQFEVFAADEAMGRAVVVFGKPIT
jgi:hypothetical protein